MCRMIGYSLVMPMPPWICRASRAMVKAMLTLFLFAIETWAGVIFPEFASVPKRQAKSCAFVISVIISANFFWVSWNCPIGLPNWIRSCEYRKALS